MRVTVGQTPLKPLELQLLTSGLVQPLTFTGTCKASVALGNRMAQGLGLPSVLFIKWQLPWYLSTTGKAACCCRPANSIQPSWALKSTYHAKAVQQHVCTGPKIKWVNLNLGSLEAVILNFLKYCQNPRSLVLCLLGKSCCKKEKRKKKMDVTWTASHV